MNSKESTILPLACGLCILAIVVVEMVAESDPPYFPQTKSEIAEKLQNDNSRQYYFKAETLVKQAIDSPSSQWSHFELKQNVTCSEIGHGVWFASGFMKQENADGTWRQSRWKVYFLEHSEKYIYMNIDNHVLGNYDEAVRLANDATLPR